MYLDFDDYRPDIQPIGRAISWREGVLISIIVHLVAVIFVLLIPRLFPYDPNAARQQALSLPDANQESPRFVFVQPRVDRTAPKPRERADSSDKDRVARSLEKKPDAIEPFSRGNSPERIESADQPAVRPQGPRPDPSEGQERKSDAEGESQPKLPDTPSALQFPVRPPSTATGINGRAMTPGGGLGEALRNLQRYVDRESFDNPQGGGQFGPELQFDTKGVEFGPWVRRFIAQVRRNWIPMIPYSAMSLRGHVVITFNVHRNGLLTDVTVVGPSQIDSFNSAAFGSLKATNPTQPLPVEYPSEQAFFTLTFYYNETPPR
jgi:TonB family protein